MNQKSVSNSNGINFNEDMDNAEASLISFKFQRNKF